VLDRYQKMPCASGVANGPHHVAAETRKPCPRKTLNIVYHRVAAKKQVGSLAQGNPTKRTLWARLGFRWSNIEIGRAPIWSYRRDRVFWESALEQCAPIISLALNRGMKVTCPIRELGVVRSETRRQPPLLPPPFTCGKFLFSKAPRQRSSACRRIVQVALPHVLVPS
jgi:hypothetical protein